MNKAVLFLQIILQFLEVRLLNQECMSMPIRQRLPRTHLEKNKVRHASLLQQGRARTMGNRGAPQKGL